MRNPTSPTSWFAVGSLGLLALASLSCGGPRIGAGSPFSSKGGGPLAVAWVVPYEDSLASLERNAPYISLVSPTYFRLRVSKHEVALEDWDPGMRFPRERLQGLIEQGRIAKASVLPLVGCIGSCGPLVSRVLDEPAARSKHVAQLIETARTQDLAGLFIDYEDVDAEKESVTRFVHELARGLHDAGKTLGFVVQEPCGAAATCKRSPYPFDLRAIADDVDVLAIMEYDYAVDGSTAPAPRKWVRAGLEAVATAVGSEQNRRKTVCAVPLYGRATAGILDDTAILYGDLVAKRAGTKSFALGVQTYDDEALSMVASLTADGRSGKVYFENHDTLARRIDLLGELKLGGVALWRLGGEDPCVTGELARYRHLPAPSGVCTASLQK